MLRLKRKCHKLKKLLHERDGTIQFLQEQHDVALPMIADETMRGIQSHMDNQQRNDDDDETRSDAVRAAMTSWSLPLT